MSADSSPPDDFNGKNGVIDLAANGVESVESKWGGSKSFSSLLDKARSLLTRHAEMKIQLRHESSAAG